MTVRPSSVGHCGDESEGGQCSHSNSDLDLGSCDPDAGYWVTTSIVTLSSAEPTKHGPLPMIPQPYLTLVISTQPEPAGLVKGFRVVIGNGMALTAVLLGVAALYRFHRGR